MNKNGIIVSMIWTLVFIGTQIASSSVGILITSIIYGAKNISEIAVSHMPIFAITGNIMFLLISFCVFKSFKKKFFMTTQKASAKQFILPLMCILFFSLAWNLVQQNLSLFDSSFGKMFNQMSHKNPIFFILAVYIFAPCIEEIAFRGIILNKLHEHHSTLLAVLGSSLLFSVTHAMTGNFITVIFAFMGGMIFSLCYLETGSLCLTILVHMVGNLCEQIAKAFVCIPIETQYILAVFLGVIAVYLFAVLCRKCSHKKIIIQ